MMWLVAALVLHPVVDEDTSLRVVATGTGDASVAWDLDGIEVARTRSGQAAAVTVPAGHHELVARTAHEGPWQVLARPEPRGEGAVYVPAWTARSAGLEREVAPTATYEWLVPVTILAAAATIALWPDRTRKV